MKILKDLMYTKTHEWIKMTGDKKAKIGLTDFAQDSLGSLVFVNLPEVGDEVSKDDSFGDVESVKAVSDVFSPVNGKVSAINEELLDSPEKINESAYDAWLIEVEDIEENKDLLTPEQYEKVCNEEA
ncbi:MAG: Glycine cleavage system H protein [Eubacteriales bacterium SKADARSKE-1]|jgi:glycine cleavage system H protein|nr:Glycine cleavage system H protein [Eubacteriales bacterium SKADARSKE-1]